MPTTRLIHPLLLSSLFTLGVVPAAFAGDLVADDGRTLWASPTSGESIPYAFVPEDSGLFLYARPASLLTSEEGKNVWRALGPAGETTRDALEASAGQPLEAIEAITLGVAPGESYDTIKTTLTCAPDPNAEEPLLSLAFEQLLDASDVQRHLTLVFSPRFLLGDGGALLQGDWSPLRELMLAQLRDEWSAASLSLHLDEKQRLYWELRVVTSPMDPEVETALGLQQQAEKWSEDMDQVVESARWSPYSANVISRSPAMWNVVGRYARRGVARRQAILNGYAPPRSAHQLLLSSERLVAELANPVTTGSEQGVATASLTLAERLAQPVTIRFAREPLETAVSILSDTIGVPIEILGRDLQLEGITRNQMLGLDVQDKPASEALVEVLRRANPDPLATGAADARQRLVYTLGDKQLTITTRAAAQQRGEELPDAFRVGK